MQVIQDVYDLASARPIDLLLLLILYDAIPTQRHPIESIIRNKIRKGLFTDGVLGKIFTNHVDVCLCSTYFMLMIYLKTNYMILDWYLDFTLILVCLQALKENFEPLKKISSLLMRSPEPLVSQAGATFYRYDY